MHILAYFLSRFNIEAPCYKKLKFNELLKITNSISRGKKLTSVNVPLSDFTITIFALEQIQTMSQEISFNDTASLNT